jgi:PhzF family phenazine biosynthesis protein
MFCLIDAFTDSQFSGNPAGVCLLDEDTFLAENILQEMAGYFNWSEIAFIKKLSENTYELRWFSPLDEAPLCGHATLCSAHYLFSNCIVTEKRIKFLYKSGVLLADRNSDLSITLTFPIKKVRECKNFPFSIKEIVGIEDFIEVYMDETSYLIVLKNHEHVRQAVPNFEKISEINCRSIIITASGFDEYDFTSRYFAPRVGIYEDPVCGSAHCRLAHYWEKRLGKTELRAFQLSKRTGILHLSIEGESVKITGNAVKTCDIEIPWLRKC